jgi:hypothetical protein
VGRNEEKGPECKTRGEVATEIEEHHYSERIVSRTRTDKFTGEFWERLEGE